MLSDDIFLGVIIICAIGLIVIYFMITFNAESKAISRWVLGKVAYYRMRFSLIGARVMGDFMWSEFEEIVDLVDDD